MKFKKYITEVTEQSFKNAKKIIEDNLNELARIFSKHSWNISDQLLISILNGLYKRYNIKFIFKIGERNNRLTKFIHSAYATEDGEVEIYIVKGTGKYFRKFVTKGDLFFDINKNMFLSDLFYFFGHELLHMKQLSKSKNKSLLDIDDKNPDDFKKYLSSKMEMEAYAQQAALELIKSKNLKSKTIDIYRDFYNKDDKVFKIFMKKVVKYKEILKNDMK